MTNGQSSSMPGRPWAWAAFALAVLAAPLAGCVGKPGDRAYVETYQYHEARRAFERTGSTEVVRQALEDAHWQSAQINEAVYRIEKEFGLHDTLPSPKRVRSEDELVKEEKEEAAPSGAPQNPLGLGQIQ